MIESVFCLLLLGADSPPARITQSLNASSTYGGMLAVQSRSSIIGAVYNQERRPIHNLRVELLDEMEGLVKATYTDSSGRYYFYNLTPGNFQVRVLTGGTDYQGRTERVHIAGSMIPGGRGAQSEQVDFVLAYKEKRGAVGAPGGVDTVFAQEVPPTARDAYQSALRKLDSDKSRDEALSELERAVRLFPNYYDALNLLGQEYIKREKYNEAEAILAKSVAVNPRSFSSWYSLGYAQYKLNQLPLAAESLTRSAGLGPKSVNAYLVLGTVQRLQRVWGPAEQNLKRARDLHKKPLAEAHWQLALLYNRTGRNAEAADELESFLKAQPNAPDAEKVRKLIGDLRKKN